MNECSTTSYDAFGFAAFCFTVGAVLIVRMLLQHRKDMARLKAAND